MNDSLPRSIRRRTARSLREKEAVVLDNYAIVREVQAGVLALNRPEAMDDHIAAIESMGLAWEFAADEQTVVILKEGEPVAFLAYRGHEFIYAPVAP